MTKIVKCIRKDSDDVVVLDMEYPRNEPVLSAYLQSPNWDCYDQEGKLLKAPEIEIHEVKYEGLRFSGSKCLGFKW